MSRNSPLQVFGQPLHVLHPYRIHWPYYLYIWREKEQERLGRKMNQVLILKQMTPDWPKKDIWLISKPPTRLLSPSLTSDDAKHNLMSFQASFCQPLANQTIALYISRPIIICPLACENSRLTSDGFQKSRPMWGGCFRRLSVHRVWIKDLCIWWHHRQMKKTATH